MGVPAFFDTYAIIEIIKDNPDYKDIARASGITLKFNLAETYYILRTQYSPNLADRTFNFVSGFVADVKPDTIKAAMIFRENFNKKNRKHALSYADAIGYTYARENGLDFVTGDDAFKVLDGVRFVK